MTKEEIKSTKLIKIKDIQSNKKVITILDDCKLTTSHSIKIVTSFNNLNTPKVNKLTLVLNKNTKLIKQIDKFHNTTRSNELHF